MGLASLTPLRLRDPRGPKLPLYKELRPTRAPSPTKERYSDDDLSSDESDDEDSDASYSSSSPRGSRDSAGSSSSAAGLMLRKKPSPPQSRRPARKYLYRLPNKVVRYLCIGMMMTIIIFILSLVRASQVENKKIAEGKLSHKKPAAPPPWESFEFLTRYYGGLKSIVPFADNVPEYPRLQDEGPYNASSKPQGSNSKAPEVNSAKVPRSKLFTQYPGSVLPSSADQVHECFLDKANTVKVPSLHYMEGRPHGFPDNIVGSYELFSLPEDICFDRFGRYAPYGYGYSSASGGLGLGEHGDRDGSEEILEASKVDWSTVNWAEAQQRCYLANARRYKPMAARGTPPHGFYIGEKFEETKLDTKTAEIKARDTTQVNAKQTKTAPASETSESAAPETSESEAPEPEMNVARTAIVVRCWDEYLWNEEAVINLRALIAELSLASAGRYDVHLLVQVRNDARYPIWADDETYRRHIRQTIPAEFQGMATLWSETQMLAVYQGVHDLFTRGPDLPVHGSYRGLQMAMQHFAYNHPEYDFYWQWEMDIRYTGHYYDLLARLENWAQAQPRKGLWERNERFYMPFFHGSWEDFKQMARVQSEHGTVNADNIWDKVPGSKGKNTHTPSLGEESVWGPQRPHDKNDWFETEFDPVPPTAYERDKYTWGVGEEADLITFSPIFNPEGTTWKLADDITGYNTSGGRPPPRRAQIITASRMSRHLLLRMHRETAHKKRHAFPEMWPATIALQHGYKAVFAPHPVFVDRVWPTEYLAHVLNGGRNGASGGARSSVFGDREHNMKGLTWFYNAGFSGNLYRRWLGLRVNNDGGEEFETTPDMSKDNNSPGTMRGGEGRMCLPPMLLHPIKDVVLPVVQSVSDAAVPESDPAA